MSILNISECNVAQLIGEANRFMFHVFLIHITTCIIEGRHTDIFSSTLFKTLLITAIAIILYHLFFRKIIEPQIKKMKSICINPNELDEIDEINEFKSNKRVPQS